MLTELVTYHRTCFSTQIVASGPNIIRLEPSRQANPIRRAPFSAQEGECGTSILTAYGRYAANRHGSQRYPQPRATVIAAKLKNNGAPAAILTAYHYANATSESDLSKL